MTTRARYNVYCDESCHLERDHQQVMTLGAVWCPKDRSREISQRIRDIKRNHLGHSEFEAKWSKVSPGRLWFYQDLIDYFFDDDDLHFRCIVIPDKSLLNHDVFRQNHDDWYYKMYYVLLRNIITPDADFFVYCDIKDTRSEPKLQRLRAILASNHLEFDRQIVRRIQSIRSHESELLQIADLLIGSIGYVNRHLATSSAKSALANRVIERSGYSLRKTTLAREEKFNILHWQASTGDQ